MSQYITKIATSRETTGTSLVPLVARSFLLFSVAVLVGNRGFADW